MRNVKCFLPLVVVIIAVLFVFSVPADAKGIGGYAGNHPLTIYEHDTINGGILYETITDGSGYTNLATVPPGFPLSSMTQNITINIPAGATVKMARLYNTYCWSTPDDGGESGIGMPAEADLTFNGVKKVCQHGLRDGIDNRNSLANSIDYNNGVIHYWDTKGQNYSGKKWDFPSGEFAWNVTDLVTGSGTYTATIANNDSSPFCGERFVTFGFGLLVVYEKPSAPEIEYWIAEGCDIVMARYFETPENATTNATFTNGSKAGNATLTTVLTCSQGGNLVPPTNMMYFNGVEIGPSTAAGDTHYGVNYFDVVTAVPDKNVVAFQDRNDLEYVHNAFLVIPAQRAFRFTGSGTRSEKLPGIDGKIEFTRSGDVRLFLLKYESNPHSPLPVRELSRSKYIDINVSVSDKDNVSWPMRVEMNYTEGEVSAAGIEDEATLAIYYWDGSSWKKCSSTGVHTGNNTIWADIKKEELGGSPLGAGGASPPGPGPVVAVPEYNLVGLIAFIAVMSVVLAVATAGSKKERMKKTTRFHNIHKLNFYEGGKR